MYPSSTFSFPVMFLISLTMVCVPFDAKMHAAVLAPAVCQATSNMVGTLFP